MQLLCFLVAGLVAVTGVHSFSIGISGVALSLVPVLAQAAPFIPEAAYSNLEKRQGGRCQSVDPRDCQKDKREQLDAARLEDEEEEE